MAAGSPGRLLLSEPVVYRMSNDSSEPTVQLHLTLEESGELCHMVMRHYLALRDAARTRVGSDLIQPKTYGVMANRTAKLWNKLARANDILMRKETPTEQLPTGGEADART